LSFDDGVPLPSQAVRTP